MFKKLIAAGAIAACATAAMASEFWDVYDWNTAQKIGTLSFETQSGNDAVYVSQDGSVRYYIRGLAGVENPRGTFQGFFIDYNGRGLPACPSGPGTDHLGNKVAHWGHLRMEWLLDEGGELAWTMSMGWCNDPISQEPVAASYQAH